MKKLVIISISVLLFSCHRAAVKPEIVEKSYSFAQDYEIVVKAIAEFLREWKFPISEIEEANGMTTIHSIKILSGMRTEIKIPSSQPGIRSTLGNQKTEIESPSSQPPIVRATRGKLIINTSIFVKKSETGTDVKITTLISDRDYYETNWNDGYSNGRLAAFLFKSISEKLKISRRKKQ